MTCAPLAVSPPIASVSCGKQNPIFISSLSLDSSCARTFTLEASLRKWFPVGKQDVSTLSGGEGYTRILPSPSGRGASISQRKMSLSQQAALSISKRAFTCFAIEAKSTKRSSWGSMTMTSSHMASICARASFGTLVAMPSRYFPRARA